MRCKKGQVLLHADIKVYTTDHRGRKLKRGHAEEMIERVLSEVFRCYVTSFGKNISVGFPDDVKVISE